LGLAPQPPCPHAAGARLPLASHHAVHGPWDERCRTRPTTPTPRACHTFHPSPPTPNPQPLNPEPHQDAARQRVRVQTSSRAGLPCTTAPLPHSLPLRPFPSAYVARLASTAPLCRCSPLKMLAAVSSWRGRGGVWEQLRRAPPSEAALAPPSEAALAPPSEAALAPPSEAALQARLRSIVAHPGFALACRPWYAALSRARLRYSIDLNPKP